MRLIIDCGVVVCRTLTMMTLAMPRPRYVVKKDTVTIATTTGVGPPASTISIGPSSSAVWATK